MNEARGVIIKDIAIHHGSLVRDNQYYYDLYGEKAFFVEDIIENVMGRDKRYVVNPDLEENSMTLGIAAAKKVLKKSNLTGKDIDMICFCTLTGESACPPGAMVIHHEIDGKDNAPCFDLNGNCVGMALAFELLSKYMHSSNGINRVLLVAAECMSLLFSPNDYVNYASYGDTGCAIIMEKTEDMSKFIDSSFHIDSSFYAKTSGPICGLSHLIDSKKEERYFTLIPPEIDTVTHAKIMKSMLEEHNLTVDDIKLFCVSQFSKSVSDSLFDELNIDEEKRVFVLKEYGYTGANSPFIVLHEVLETGKVNRGDYIFIWTIGANYQAIMTLFKY